MYIFMQIITNETVQQPDDIFLSVVQLVILSNHRAMSKFNN